MKRKVENVFVVIGILSLIFIIIPVIIGIIVSVNGPLWLETSNEWIGFWGGYLGSILGGIITLLVLWYTIKDNKKARDREEKIIFYDRLIEIESLYCQEIGNYFSLITRVMVEKNNELYRMCIQAGNEAAKTSIELSIRTQIKKEEYDISKIIDLNDEIANKVNEIANMFDEQSKKRFEDEVQCDLLSDKMDELLVQMNEYTEKFTNIIKNDLNT